MRDYMVTKKTGKLDGRKPIELFLLSLPLARYPILSWARNFILLGAVPFVEGKS